MDFRRLPHTFAPSSWYRFAFTARFMWLRHAVKPVTVKLMHFTQVYWFAAFSASERGRSEHVAVDGPSDMATRTPELGAEIRATVNSSAVLFAAAEPVVAEPVAVQPAAAARC